MNTTASKVIIRENFNPIRQVQLTALLDSLIERALLLVLQMGDDQHSNTDNKHLEKTVKPTSHYHDL